MKNVNYEMFLSLFIVLICSFSLAAKNGKGHKANSLMRAIKESNDKKVARLLLMEYNGPNINDQDEEGNTALHLAAIKGDLVLIKKLLRFAIINTSLANTADKTAYDLARDAGHKRAALLIKYHKPASVEPRRSGSGRRQSSPTRKSYNYTF